MNFLDLKNEVRQTLFADGEQENLVGPHDKKFVEAMVDLQDAVPCLRYGNTNIFAQCGTFFDCGMTVLPAPRGQILALYTIGKQQDASGIANGTVVGSLDIPASDNQLLVAEDGSLVPPDPTERDVLVIPSDGIYTVSVQQVNAASALYPANSAQYFRTEIIYTDTNGAQQTIQPAPLIHMNLGANNGSTVISAQAGSTLSCRVSSFNLPPVDGGVEVIISVVKGSQVNNDDWCSKVFYDRVDYPYLERYGRLCPRQTTGIRAIADALFASIFGFGKFRVKRSYPAPDDAGYQLLPALPQGFHYPQRSTDAGGRSRRGVYAIHHGRIYIAPWIESTESVVIEWNGKKTDWGDADAVDSDPKFKKAVTEYVGREHFTYYEENETKLQHLATNYALTVRELINDCRNRTRSMGLTEAGVSASAATGIGIIDTNIGGGATFYNDVQSYTAVCPAGQSGQPVTSTVAAHQVASTLSVADANARALSQATADAQQKLVCGTSSGQFLNTVQSYTASCPAANGTSPAAVGTPVTATIPAGAYQSAVSQELADAAALQAAMNQANAQLSCTFYNAPQTVTASCPDGTTGSQQTSTTPAGQFSDVTQQGADTQALAAAQSAASALLSCSSATFQVGNTTQQATRVGTVVAPGCGRPFNYNLIIITPANTYVGQATAASELTVRLQLNSQALAAAQSAVNALYTQQLNSFIANCPPGFS
jgi:hypothetical protein